MLKGSKKRIPQMKKRLTLTKEVVETLKSFCQSHETDKSEAARAQAILLLSNGCPEELIEEITGLSIKHVFHLRAGVLSHGVDVLVTKRKAATKTLLTKKQREEILTMLNTETPRKHNYSTDFWTTGILARIIKQRYNVDYKSKTSLKLIFKAAKFTYHKPDKCYKKRDEAIIQQWREKWTPIIKSYINDPNVVVLFGDEMILTTQTTTQRIWLPVGVPAKIEECTNRKRRGIYGFVDVKTGREYAFKASGMNSVETCLALDKLAKIHHGKKIVIVWDNASWHKSQQVRDFLSTTKHDFYLIALPPYAPELNPQEHVWKRGRQMVTHNTYIDDIDKTTDLFVNFLHIEKFDYEFDGCKWN